MEQKQICCDHDRLPPLSPKYPWFVAQLENDSEVQIFYTLNQHYLCRIPELVGKRIRGCFHGWVVLSDDIMWSLWDPLASKSINLPPLKDPNDIDLCCLSSPPNDPNSILLLTRTEKPNFVFCRLNPKRKKIKWTEMTYGKQLRNISGVTDGLLFSLTCCNGKIYALNSGNCDRILIHVEIVVKDKQVVINLLPILDTPCPNLIGCLYHQSTLRGSNTELFCIVTGFKDQKDTICFKEQKNTIGRVFLYKLDMNRMIWEEMEDLKDTIFSMEIGNDFLSGYYSPAIASESELGGYIHYLCENRRMIYSYHVKDKTLSLSPIPCPIRSSHVSSWTILESRLEKDIVEVEDKDNEIVLARSVTNDESLLLNIPFHILEMIMEFCAGVEYLKFRATCKRCHLAAPLIQWSNETKKRLTTFSPWLIVFDTLKGIITFTDPMFGDKYFIKTPQELIGGFKIRCSGYGWLLLSIPKSGKHVFFNPFTSDIRELPVTMCLKSYSFSAPPTSPDCMVVGFTTFGDYHVYIHFVSRGLNMGWRRYGLNFGGVDPFSFRFPTFCGRDLFALTNNGDVDVFTQIDQEDFFWDGVESESPTSCCGSLGEYFLVKHDQHLLLVIVGEFGKSIEVFKLNDGKKWEKIDSLGRHMIYICDSKCLCVEAKTPKMENKIYFPRLHSENGDIVFYSLETCKYHTFKDHETFGDLFGTKCYLAPHAWIEPCWSS